MSPRLIICAGAPRSGSTLQYQIVKNLLISRNVYDAGFLFNEEEFLQLTNFQGYPFTICKTHKYFESIKSLYENFNITIFTSFRDIRDIFTSMMEKENLPFEKVYSKTELNKIINNHSCWSDEPNAINRKYEEFCVNLQDEIRLFAYHLGLSITEDEVKRLAEKLSFNSQFEFQKSITSKYDVESLLHKNHLQNGSWGQFKNKLTKLQIGIIQSKSKKWLKMHDYPLISTAFNNTIIWKSAKAINKISSGSIFIPKSK